MCDEAVIHHVEEASKQIIDQRLFVCWTFAQDPSRIPQVVYLTLANHDVDPRRRAQVHFRMPRAMKRGHIFRVLIHIDLVEDLSFYHFPREELLSNGRVRWRDFRWHLGHADGELEEEEVQPPTTHYRLDRYPNTHQRDDEDDDREPKRSCGIGFLLQDVRLY